ncbi:beta-N-acetylhexosaminidase [Daejeonella sp.]|uniref:beta-N-acetylhexosaminidase n=1 Tax=Daejeonella sp. TaxID=2805397 RepID=UPI0027BABB58|nr:beta-N-acetylhexosaminidase [Daejeonella sp.]
MNKQILFLLFFLISFNSTSQVPTNTISIIPQPVHILKGTGHFTFPKEVLIHAPDSPELVKTISILSERLSLPTGYQVSSANSSNGATIKLLLNDSDDSQLGKEGYTLSVTHTGIKIKANKPAGLFYGVQTLLQLLPSQIESKVLIKNINWVVPIVEIQDFPKLGWRGLMFDVARHFFTKDEVKQYIDAMSKYKYNVLHLHLTDDEGWRIEIKGYPKLTEIGAWNVKREGEFGDFIPPLANEPRNYGGFYTQEDIKELVRYAKDRFIEIMPEVDVPGHSLAAIASYPELSCTPDAVNYKVRSGEKIMDWSGGATPKALLDNTLCPANELAYSFMDSVISQLATLFPFEYIHLGGDEAPINFWQKNEQIKALMAREGIKNSTEVQGYFTRRVEKIVESKGKKMMAWDEVLEGGVSPTTAVMSWRGMKYGIEAALNKHEVVMSPTTYAYLDYMQSDVISEPRVYASLRLNKSYEFEPVPEGVDPQYIKGGQANLWTEQVYTIRQAEYMTWPRAFAIAESVWSPKDKKNWPEFFSRVEEHFKRLDFSETKYSPAVYDPIFKVGKTSDNKLTIDLSLEVEGLDIYYSFDNSFPDRFYPKYMGTLTAPIDAKQLKLITYKDKVPVGRMLTMPIADLKRRARL